MSDLSQALYAVQQNYPDAEDFMVRAFGRNWGRYESHPNLQSATRSFLGMLLHDNPDLYDDIHYDIYYYL